MTTDLSGITLSNEELRKEAERIRRNVEVMLIAAYHQSKALSELLTAVHRWNLLLPADEAPLAREAAKGAVDVYAALNKIVGDQGNQLGAVINNKELAQRVGFDAGLL